MVKIQACRCAVVAVLEVFSGTRSICKMPVPPPASRARIPLALVPSGFLEGWEDAGPSAGVSDTSAIPRVVDMSGTWSQEDDERMRQRLAVPCRRRGPPTSAAR